MQPDLPVWTIRPNWKDGILERLEWLTDVLPSSTGAEQRRSLRLSPRRSLEITVNPTHGERTFLDLTLHAMGSAEWLMPIWWDKAKLLADVIAGGKRLGFDNTYREFTNGGMALIYFDTWTWEVVTIASQDAGGLNLTDALDGPWPKGSVIYPLRKGYFDTRTDIKALTARVGESTLLFGVNEANDWTETAPTTLYLGIPVLTTPPNRSSEITSTHTRLVTERDSTIGLRQRTDSAGRAFAAQAHNWMLKGRKAQSDLRSLLYWMRGRQRAVWLPTFNEDVTVTRAAAQGAINLDIRRIGLGYVGGVVPGRDHIWIGGQGIQITDMGAAQTPQEERLRIGAGLPVAQPVGRPGSFLDASRLDSDTIELHHHADSDGALEVATTFHAFRDMRQAAGAIYYPIPATATNDQPCGTPPEPWFWHVRLVVAGTGPHDWYYNPAWCFKNAGAPYGDFPHFTGYEMQDWTMNWFIDEQLLSGQYMVCSMWMNNFTEADAAKVTEFIPGVDGSARGWPRIRIQARRRGEPFVDCIGPHNWIRPGDLFQYGWYLP